MGREAWYDAVHGVTKSWTWLSDWTELKIQTIRINFKKLRKLKIETQNFLEEVHIKKKKTYLDMMNDIQSKAQQRWSEGQI